MDVRNKYTGEKEEFDFIFDRHKWPYSTDLTMLLFTFPTACFFVLSLFHIAIWCTVFTDNLVSQTFANMITLPNVYIDSKYGDDGNFGYSLVLSIIIITISILAFIPVSKSMAMFTIYDHAAHSDQEDMFKDKLKEFFTSIVFHNTVMKYEKAEKYINKVYKNTYLTYLRILLKPFKLTCISSIILLTYLVIFTIQTDKVENKALQCFINNKLIEQTELDDALKHFSKATIIREILTKCSGYKPKDQTVIYSPYYDKVMYYKEYEQLVASQTNTEHKEKKVLNLNIHKEVLDK